MEALARSFASSLNAGAPDLDLLARLGVTDPRRTADALLQAADEPTLRASLERWLPEVLSCARPEFAVRTLVELSQRHADVRGRPLDLQTSPALPRLLGSSTFLARILLRHPEWVDGLEGDLPAGPCTDPVEAEWTAIRAAKYQGLLRIAARDLSERPFEQSLKELSDLADRALEASLRCSEQETGVARPVLFALGKLGGSELNLSSDVDVLFVHDTLAGDVLAEQASIDRFIRHFKRQLEAPSEDGFGYRVDLDLRPEGRVGALANSVEAALTYYESYGAEWERQMLIRLRPIAGKPELIDQFTRAITPFVYRTLIDPFAIDRVREMKTRVEAERRSAGRDLEADLKEGPGGIRDVEFLVQALQLFHGGREPTVRHGNVCAALDALRERRLLPPDVTMQLRDAYLWLRRAEHCVQLAEERQTHRFPRDPQAQLELARCMGYRDAEGAQARDRLLDDWTQMRVQVREPFERLVLETAADD